MSGIIPEVTDFLPIMLHITLAHYHKFPSNFIGKTILEQEGAKELIMRLMHHEDSNTRMEALLAVQKMMVHNWEYLGKQTEAAVSK